MAFLFARKGGRKRMVGEYEVGETIGEGTSSKVKLGREPLSGRLVALKIMDPDAFRTQAVQQELEILRYFGEPRNRHPNVCGLVTVLHDVDYLSKHGKPRSSYESKRVSVIVTDYLDGGDLFSYVAAGIPFNEDTARAVFQQVVRGVSHLHKHGVVHLDIKPENILIGRNGIIKLTDFGLSEIVKPLRSGRRGSTRAHGGTRKARLGAMDISRSGRPCAHHGPSGGIRAVASLNSLESLTSSIDSSPSPLTGFYPTPSALGPFPGSGFSLPHSHSVEGPFRRGDSTPESSSGSPAGSPLSASEDPRAGTADAELFQAISTGRTRGAASGSGDNLQRTDSLSSNRSGGIRSSASMNGLSSLVGRHTGMGNKVSSYNSISSLESSHSLGSRWSRESKSSGARYNSPRLVVNSRSGTLCYQAPEVNVGNYDGCRADVFSLGIVLHVMLYGVLPFDDGATEEYHSSIDGGHEADEMVNAHHREWAAPVLLKHDVELSEDAIDLLKGMLLLDPQARFNLKDTMRHAWVDAAQVRGSVQKVAALVRRREHYVVETRKNQSYLRKARKRGLGVRSHDPDDIFA